MARNLSGTIFSPKVVLIWIDSEIHKNFEYPGKTSLDIPKKSFHKSVNHGDSLEMELEGNKERKVL